MVHETQHIIAFTIERHLEMKKLRTLAIRKISWNSTTLKKLRCDVLKRVWQNVVSTNQIKQ